MLALLFIYRGRAVPELSMGLTFNTVISVLITAAKAGMRSAVASAIGQIKWTRFQSRRSPLYDFEVFDQASRGGPLGAINFLTSIGWASSAAIGAVVVLLSLAMDPFAQQVLTYPVRLTFEDSAEAKLAFATNINPANPELDFLIQQNVNQAMWNNTPGFSAFCGSGNCTYPPVQTLSWCPRCEDITEAVELNGCEMAFDFSNASCGTPSIGCEISISSGLNMTMWNSADRAEELENSAYGPPQNVFTIAPVTTFVWDLLGDSYYPWSGYSYQSFEFLGERYNMVALGQVDLKFDPIRPFSPLTVKRALGCVMNPCVRQYSVSINAGSPLIESIKISDGTVASIGGENSGKFPPWAFTGDNELQTTCWVSNYTLLSDSNAAIGNPQLWPYGNETLCSNGLIFSKCTIDTTAIMCADEASRQARVIPSLLTGNVTSPFLISGPITYPIPWSENTTASQNDTTKVSAYDTVYSSYTLKKMLLHEGLNVTLHNIAESLTVMMQNVSTSEVTGQVGRARAFVQVQWLWLIYPAFVIFAGIVLVLHTIVDTKRAHMHVWKNSSLAVMYHGVGVDDKTRLQVVDANAMVGAAKKTVVQLEGSRLKQ